MSTLSVCLIVKDEEKNIARALKSVADVADEILVVDTGSTDATRDLATQAGARVIRHDWQDDFSEARNFALDQAACEWSLQLDADEELQATSPKYIAGLLAAEDVHVYQCQIMNMRRPDSVDGAVSSRFPRLFRRHVFRYEGIVHEAPAAQNGESPMGAPSELTIVHWGYMDKQVRPKRVKRNRLLILQALEADPDNFLLYFYLGENYVHLARTREALKCFERADFLCPPEAASYKALLSLRVCECLRRLKRYEEARRCVEFGIESFPDYRDLLFLGGHIYEARGDWQSALSCYERCAAMSIVPTHYLFVRQGLDKTAAERAQKCRQRVGG